MRYILKHLIKQQSSLLWMTKNRIIGVESNCSDLDGKEWSNLSWFQTKCFTLFGNFSTEALRQRSTSFIPHTKFPMWPYSCLENKQDWISHCGAVEMNLTSTHEVWSLASLSGLGIQCCRELWCRSQIWLWHRAGSYSSD